MMPAVERSRPREPAKRAPGPPGPPPLFHSHILLPIAQSFSAAQSRVPAETAQHCPGCPAHPPQPPAAAGALALSGGHLAPEPLAGLDPQEGGGRRVE